MEKNVQWSILPHRKGRGFYLMFPCETWILPQLAFLVVCQGLVAGQITSRYYLIQIPVPWLEAREFCQSHYVDIAILTTEEEYFTFLSDLPACKVSFWLGLQRQSIISGWKWISGEELGYKHWYRMNDQGLCVSLEAMLDEEEKLLARFCDETHMIACQGPVSPQSVSVSSVSSSHLTISWNISAFMQMTPHTYNVTICHSLCETSFHTYTYGSSLMSINISNLTASTEYFIQITAFVVRPQNASGGQTILQDKPATLQVKTMDPEPQTVPFIIMKWLKVILLAPLIWIIYYIVKKDFTEVSQDKSSAEHSAPDTVINLLRV